MPVTSATLEADLRSLGIALALGLLVGIERGWHLREHADGTRVAGVRTFGLAGLLGGVAALLSGAIREPRDSRGGLRRLRDPADGGVRRDGEVAHRPRHDDRGGGAPDVRLRRDGGRGPRARRRGLDGGRARAPPHQGTPPRLGRAPAREGTRRGDHAAPADARDPAAPADRARRPVRRGRAPHGPVDGDPRRGALVPRVRGRALDRTARRGARHRHPRRARPPPRPSRSRSRGWLERRRRTGACSRRESSRPRS